MSDSYSTLAQFYDLLIGVDYQEWVKYLLQLGLRNHHLPNRILDFGCGTGNLTIPLARRGYQLVGVDLSQEMIRIAKEKALASEVEIPFLTGDIRNFQFSGHHFDTVICGCDVLNYLIEPEGLLAAFETIHDLLIPGGLWLFDLNSEFKLREIYGNESYADLADDFAYFWDNGYNEKTDICTMNLTFFVRTDLGLYEKKREQHQQKLWTIQDVEKLCEASGFHLCAVHDFLFFNEWTPQSERWQFVLQKI